MGNTNQGGSTPAQNDRNRQRRASTSDAMGPLEVPLGSHRYNVETSPPNSSQILFGKHLVESLSPENVAPVSDHYHRRYRAGSISLEPASLTSAMTTKIPAVIKWDKDGRDVAVSGSFNNWERRIPLVRSEKNFYTIVEVSEGEHQYKFHVDGQWRCNLDEPTMKGPTGVLNNVLKVSKDDFEFLHALESDKEATLTKSSDILERPNKTISPEGREEYGQEMPIKKSTDQRTGPPILPPQLLQVILNKDVPDHLEPGLLPEPNHVMLHHLYALSIKDGVMVLSDTSRYKKKYVTTLLYKPIDS